LSKIPLFATLSNDDREALIDELENHVFQPGDYLVKQGEPGRQLFVLLSGKARAVFRDSNGKQHEVGVLLPGDTFGEIALIDEVPRTASIVALARSHAVALDKDDFSRLVLTKVPDVDRIKQMIRLSSFFRRHPLLVRLEARVQAEIIGKLRYRSFVSNETLVSAESVEPRFGIVYTGRLQATQRDLLQPLALSSADAFGFLLAGRTPAFLPEVVAREGGGLLTLSQVEFTDHVLRAAVPWVESP